MRAKLANINHCAIAFLSLAAVKARGVKMPYFDFSLCYRAGKNEQDAKNGRLI